MCLFDGSVNELQSHWAPFPVCVKGDCENQNEASGLPTEVGAQVRW